ncbi:MAG: hypothetical protein KF769_15565 [Parvibaculum sp.]|nr:hypothetical protein [Parvibaculum sp.]
MTPAESAIEVTSGALAQNVSITTVRTHFVQMREKLGARDQADVVRIALRGGEEI